MICIWSSWCHCYLIISCFIKIQIGLTFLMPAYPGCPGKEAIKQVSECLSNVAEALIVAGILLGCCCCMYSGAICLQPLNSNIIS